MMKCPVCLNTEFKQTTVLKSRLIEEWGLLPDEVSYINEQQGLICMKCFCNLRSMTLAGSIIKHNNFHGSFRQFCHSLSRCKLRILEINEAGNLHPYLKGFRDYVFAEYPDIDIQNLPFRNCSFDIIIHSDTLEHVENSLLGLKECYRVLKNGGRLFYTIPIIYSRLTRKRERLEHSYHGNQDETSGIDYKVITEYGSDFWVEIIKAGFCDISIHSLGDPGTLSISAEKREINYRKYYYIDVLEFLTKFLRKATKWRID